MNSAYNFNLYIKGNYSSRPYFVRFPWVAFIYRFDCIFILHEIDVVTWIILVLWKRTIVKILDSTQGKEYTIWNNYITSVFHWNVTIWLAMKWSYDYKRDVSHPNETHIRTCTSDVNNQWRSSFQQQII